MKMLYIANVRMPTEKAHGIQIMKMLEAFSNFQFFPPHYYKNQKTGGIPQGGTISNFQSNYNDQIPKKIDVELVVPWRFNPIKEDPFEYYGVEKKIKITKLPCLDLLPLVRILGPLAFLIQSFSFAKTNALYMLFRKADIIYSRDELPLFFLSFFPPWRAGKKNLIWEAHDGRYNPAVKRILKKCKGIIAISQGLKDFYVKNGADASKILVAPDAVDLEEFDIKISKEEARRKLDLPFGEKIILYTGHLYDWKGVGVLAEASQYLDNDFLVVFIGGTKEDIEKFKIQNSLPADATHQALQAGKFKIFVVGHRPHKEIPYWLKAADVLVLPNKSGDDNSEKYTSPLKLFEYMASERPIVASDLPSLREVLNKENAVLVEPDRPEKLADGIKMILQNPVLADKISKQALEDVKQYTWVKRAERIFKFIVS